MRFIGTDSDRSVLDSMTSYRPKYYETSNTVNEITRVDAIELEELYNQVLSVFQQFFIDTATWGLDKWEQALDIPIDKTKTDVDRRGVIKSKFRTQGVATIDVVKSVAESYLNGEVDILEKNSEYTIKITFVGKHGVPPNLNDIKTAIRGVTPAHLALEYIITYSIWNNIEVFTFNDLDIKTWDQLESVM